MIMVIPMVIIMVSITKIMIIANDQPGSILLGNNPTCNVQLCGPQKLAVNHLNRIFQWNSIRGFTWKIFNRNPTIINKRMDNHQNPFTPVIAPCIGRYGVVVNLAPCVTTIVASKNVDSVITFVHSGAMPVFFLLVDVAFHNLLGSS